MNERIKQKAFTQFQSILRHQQSHYVCHAPDCPIQRQYISQHDHRPKFPFQLQTKIIDKNSIVNKRWLRDTTTRRRRRTERLEFEVNNSATDAVIATRKHTHTHTQIYLYSLYIRDILSLSTQTKRNWITLPHLLLW